MYLLPILNYIELEIHFLGVKNWKIVDLTSVTCNNYIYTRDYHIIPNTS